MCHKQIRGRRVEKVYKSDLLKLSTDRLKDLLPKFIYEFSGSYKLNITENEISYSKNDKGREVVLISKSGDLRTILINTYLELQDLKEV